MSYMVLIPAALCFCACATLSYSDDLRDHWWYRLAGACLGACVTYLWFVGADLCGSKPAEYRLGAAWDATANVVWFVVPLFLGVRLSWIGLAGVVLILGGALLVNAGK